MENIANFLKAIRALGMKEFEMFGTPDLYDEKNVAQVARSIHALGRLLQDIMPDAPFPKLGIKVVAKNVSIHAGYIIRLTITALHRFLRRTYPCISYNI